MALSHPEAEPATGFELEVHRFPFLTAPGAPPSHEATNSSARRLGAAPRGRNSPKREAVSAQKAAGFRGLPHGGMQPRRDDRRSANDDGLCPPELEEHRVSPDGDRPSRHRPPPTFIDENDGVHYHVERLVGRRRRRGFT
ncbi:uncharacterized protein PHALS_00594 [Plasmopara halstedii]|uniref:Uncharacterized protein n=1 Tax=Plasmopara halstedii TaxID=4781 RepID=A0A0P1B7N8_PLAHL|nr:uncharacterized protein PHALS_00594 [Plasmopara halstedii]CEG50450.1 hypothetical protein PHALS_00594 [Plasmopara halstedii]|eukprot:XP_024586819.1 hypothetical protein PHALS_00594 [Plasmopara halstedii]